MNRDLLRQELSRDEGRRTTAYQDSVGLWTNGVGHLLGKDPPEVMTVGEEQVDAWLEADIDDAIERLWRWLPADLFETLSDARQRALVNMSFNLGNRLGQFRRFWKAVNFGDWPAAGFAMMDSKWATQVGARADRLRDMIVGGE
jgi:lysozyme